MKKIIAAAGIGAALATAAVLGASPANANPSQDALVYMQMLNNDGISVYNAAAAISSGYQMCNQIAAGYTPVQVANQLWLDIPSYTRQDAASDTVDAVMSLCPAYLPALNTPNQPARPSQGTQLA